LARRGKSLCVAGQAGRADDGLHLPGAVCGHSAACDRAPARRRLFLGGLRRHAVSPPVPARRTRIPAAEPNEGILNHPPLALTASRYRALLKALACLLDLTEGWSLPSPPSGWRGAPHPPQA